MSDEEMYARLEKLGVNVRLLKGYNLTAKDLREFTTRIEGLVSGYGSKKPLRSDG